MEYIHRYRNIIIAFAVSLAVVLIGIATSGSGTVAVVPTTGPVTAGDTSTTTSAQVVDSIKPDSEVAPLDCGSLVTSTERGDALDVFNRPADQRDSMMFSKFEACTETMVDDEDSYVGIQPGNPADFEDGATFNATTGEKVDIADGGRWFGGETAGTLAVRNETSLGVIHFRIVLGRPDLDDLARRDIAVDLALKALPRFPGVEIEPVIVSIPDESPDRSGIGYVDNLLAKADDGEWTVGEGLVATLRLFAGETEPADVLRQGELEDYEGTGVLEMARDYLEDGSDEAVKAEIKRLLDQLVLSNEELERMAGIGPTTLALPGTPGLEWAQAAEQDCTQLFGEDAGIGQCLVFESFEVDDKQYRVFRPAPSLPQGGWTDEKFKLAVTAVKESIPKLDAIGATPPANLVFSLSGEEYADASYVAGEPCAIRLFTKIQPFKAGDFKQVIAHELGHCFNGETFPVQKDVDYASRKWWEEGLADYWSNIVYTSNNLEWRTLDRLAGAELATTIFERSYANSIFFQQLEAPLGITGIQSVIRNLPASNGIAEQVQRMASFNRMNQLFHDFAKAMADSQVSDTSKAHVPYKPVGWDLAISGPTEVPLTVPAFGVRRLDITVPPGMYGCYTTFAEGAQLVSWRSGGVGKPGTWDQTGPYALEGETTMVVTAVQDGASFTLQVNDVDDDPDCTHEDPGQGCDLGLICDPSGYFFLITLED